LGAPVVPEVDIIRNPSEPVRMTGSNRGLARASSPSKSRSPLREAPTTPIGGALSTSSSFGRFA